MYFSFTKPNFRLLYIKNHLLSLPLPVADTKRKVEQISEELKNLDEILSKDEGTNGASEKTDVTVESTDTQATGYPSFHPSALFIRTMVHNECH